MQDIQITRKQFAAAIFTSLLSPLMRVLPRASILLGGKGAWLAVIPAGLALTGLYFLVQSLCRQLRPGEGMAGLFMRFLGPVAGRVVLILYTLWFLFYTGFVFRSGAERLTDTVYHQSSLDPFVLVMVAVCLIVTLGTLRAAARTAVLLRAILLGVLIAVFFMVIPNISVKNLFPLYFSDTPGILLGAWPILSVGGIGAYLSFLEGYTERPKNGIAWMWPSLVLFLFICGILCFQVVGTFGENLSTQMSYPFFTMVRDVSLFNIAQRFEAIVIVLWVLADFMLCTMLLRCAYEALRAIFKLDKTDGLPIFSLKNGRWLIWLCALTAFGCSHMIASSSYEILALSNQIIPLISNILVFGGFSVLWVVGKARNMIKNER
jgi:spore germination protein KB